MSRTSVASATRSSVGSWILICENGNATLTLVVTVSRVRIGLRLRPVSARLGHAASSRVEDIVAENAESRRAPAYDSMGGGRRLERSTWGACDTEPGTMQAATTVAAAKPRFRGRVPRDRRVRVPDPRCRARHRVADRGDPVGERRVHARCDGDVRDQRVLSPRSLVGRDAPASAASGSLDDHGCHRRDVHADRGRRARALAARRSSSRSSGHWRSSVSSSRCCGCMRRGGSAPRSTSRSDGRRSRSYRHCGVRSAS